MKRASDRPISESLGRAGKQLIGPLEASDISPEGDRKPCEKLWMQQLYDCQGPSCPSAKSHLDTKVS